MTVKVTLPDGGLDSYMRFGDTYVEHGDGSLDVIRTGVKDTLRYTSDEWVGVESDRNTSKTRFFRR